MKEVENMTMYKECLLHSRADRALRMVVGHALADYNITMMQWLLLSTVDQGQSSGTRMTELAETLDVTMPQITALMNDLIDLKYAKQKVNASDRRSRRLIVTPLGKTQLNELEPAVEKALNKWFANIPEKDLSVYRATIKHLSELNINTRT